MQIIRHRVNSRALLETVPSEMGVEIDLRSRNDKLILQHDPYKDGELFEEWLSAWSGQFLILNIKEEGLEQSIIDTLVSRSIDKYFFLDQSFPFMQKLIRNGNCRVAARASDLESVTTVIKSGAEWCWLDSFSGSWNYLTEIVPLLRNRHIRTCLVSPELQRGESAGELTELRDLIRSEGLNLDAVCTKIPEEWQ